MNWDSVIAIASVAQFIIALIGIFLIYRQICHVKNQIKGSASAALYEQMIEIDRYFVDRPDLKQFIYGNKIIGKNNTNYEKIRSLAEMMSDLMEHAYVQRNNLPPDVWPRWVDYMTYLYDSSPILRQHLHESGTWYADNILFEIGRTGRMKNDNNQKDDA